jgi:hypothetical protein
MHSSHRVARPYNTPGAKTVNSGVDVQDEGGCGRFATGAILVHLILLVLAFLFGCIAGCEKPELYGVMSGTGGGVRGVGFSASNVGISGGFGAVGNVLFCYATTCGLLPLAVSLVGAVLWTNIVRMREAQQRQ